MDKTIKYGIGDRRHFKIVEITVWDIDLFELMGDCSHNGENYNSAVGEAEHRVELLKELGGAGLPFVCEADSEEEALSKYNEVNSNGLYVRAAEAEIKELRKFHITMQVDCQAETDVYAENADEAADVVRNRTITAHDITEVLDSHVMYAHDETTDKTTTFID